MLTDDQRIARRTERRVLRFIREQELLGGGERLLLAVSGGADSLALLGIMARLTDPLDVDVQATYVDHHLRPEEEIVADIATVAGIAAALNVAFHPCAVCDSPHGRGRSPEEGARLARYRALAAEASRTGAALVATGHTKSDQAETVLLRLLRGSGLRGLGAMAPLAPWPVGDAPDAPVLIRPLLPLDREETAAYCRARGFQPRHDRENDNPRYQRNRIRHEIMPRLRELNPTVERALVRLAEEARAHTTQPAGGEADVILAPWDGRQLVLDRHALRGMAVPARLMVLRAALQGALPDPPAPARAHLEALERLVTLDRAAEAHLPRGLRAWTDGPRLVIGRQRPVRPPLPELPVPVPGVVWLPGWRVTAANEDCGDAPPRGAGSMTLMREAAAGLTVGPRRPGDRIDVGAGQRRVQDLLVDAKVPRWERDQIPVFRTPRGIVWLAGVRAAGWAVAHPPGPSIRLTVERIAPEHEPARPIL